MEETPTDVLAAWANAGASADKQMLSLDLRVWFPERSLMLVVRLALHEAKTEAVEALVHAEKVLLLANYVVSDQDRTLTGQMVPVVAPLPPDEEGQLTELLRLRRKLATSGK